MREQLNGKWCLRLASFYLMIWIVRPAWMFRGSCCYWEGYYRPTRGCVGYHNPWGRHDPGSVPIVPGERFRRPFGVAIAGVALGVAVVLSNRHAQTHCRLLLPARDRIQVLRGSGK